MRTSTATKDEPFFGASLFPVLCSVAIEVYYLAWTTFLFRPVRRGLVFNSMLEHLLRGDFGVDADIIGSEGFALDGGTYSYFGIFPALLRLPFYVAGLNHLDLTTLFCVTAAAVSVFFKLSAVRAIFSAAPPSPLRNKAVLCVVLVILFGGPELQSLKPSIYQEVISWSGALGAAFVYFAIRGLVTKRVFSSALLIALSVVAGLTLLTRVSVALGLYIALALLLLCLAWRNRPAFDGDGRLRAVVTAPAALIASVLRAPGSLAALIVLAVFAVVCGYVNYRRWGNPTTFLPYALNIDNQSVPTRIAQFQSYGAFNLERLWFGLLYYFLPIWGIIRPDGRFLFAEFQDRMINATELPPSSFFVSDPLLICLAVYGVIGLARGGFARPIDRGSATAVLAGLAVPIPLICMAIYLAFRYRMEFHPALTWSALLGLLLIVAGERTGDAPARGGWLIRAMPVLTAVGIVVSHLLMFAYKISPFGHPAFIERVGWWDAYVTYFRTALDAAGG